MPQYFTDAVTRQYGQETAALVFDGMKEKRRASLRANRLKTRPEDVAALLESSGISFSRLPWSEDAFLLTEAAENDIRRLPAYEKGEIYLQSLSSMLPPILLDPQPGTDILDMAAAPGSKTCQIAAMTDNKAGITACEISGIRAEKLKYNLQRQGAGRVSVMVRDARKLEDYFRFDRILLDAPCSGSGTLLACDPGSLKAFSEKLVHNSAMLQRQMLQKALKILKNGCTMVYSTCSILKEENEDTLLSVLKNTGAGIEPISFPGMESLPLLPVSLPGTLCIRPTREYEGFFMACIRKN